VVSQQQRGLVGKHAVRTTAIRDDLAVARQLGEAMLEFFDWDRASIGDMALPVLESRPYIEQGDTAISDKLFEFRQIHRSEAGAIGKIRLNQTVHLREPFGAKVAQAAPQCGNLWRSQTIDLVETSLVALDQPRLAQNLEMRRRVCKALIDFRGELLDGALPLIEQVEEFEAVWISESAADAGELSIETVLELTVTHMLK
jgi:hypothetical protein